LELARGPASSAVFPGFTQVGRKVCCAPTDLIGSKTTFTLRVTASGKLYEGFMTFWADAGDGFCCPTGTMPVPGNPNWASAAFDINVASVPEPVTATWLGLVLAGVGFSRRRGRQPCGRPATVPGTDYR
jgi:hypothetical protein